VDIRHKIASTTDTIQLLLDVMYVFAVIVFKELRGRSHARSYVGRYRSSSSSSCSAACNYNGTMLADYTCAECNKSLNLK